MTAEVTREVHCAYCKRPVTLREAQWPSVVRYDNSPDRPVLMRFGWSCPYCLKVNEGSFPGRLVRIIKGH